MLERDLYQKFKKLWKYYSRRIEPKGTGGIPDLHLVNRNDLVIFVELKSIRKPKNKLTIPIRQSQLLWFMNYPALAYALVCLFDEDNGNNNNNLYCLFPKKSIPAIKTGIVMKDLKKYAIIASKDLEKCIAELAFIVHARSEYER